MKKKVFKIGIVVVISAIIYACSTTTYVLTTNDENWANQKWAGTKLVHLQKGQALYNSKCGSCHFLHAPSKFTVNQWQQIIPKMATKANLKPAEQELITRYLLTAGRDTITTIR